MDPNIKHIYQIFLGGKDWNFFYGNDYQEVKLRQATWARRWLGNLTNKQFIRDTDESRTKIPI